MDDAVIEVTRGHGNHRIITTDQVARIGAVIAAASDFLEETMYSHDAILSDKENDKWEALYLSVSSVGTASRRKY